jgi:hypothetical protein
MPVTCFGYVSLSMHDRMTPRILHMPDVARELGRSVRWLQYYLRDNPHGRKVGRTRIFTEADFQRLLDSLPQDTGTKLCLSSSSRRTRSARPITGSEALSTASTWTDRVRRQIKEKRERSLKAGQDKSSVVPFPAERS